MHVENSTCCFVEISTFSKHPDFKEDVSKTFLVDLGKSQTATKEKLVDLDTYLMNIYGDKDEVFVPLALLSSFSGGDAGYNIAYNGSDIYVLDGRPQLSPEKRDAAYFGNAYLSVIKDFDTPRYEDMAKVNYGLICFTFDVLRGYTAQLIFGDNNLLSLGLDGVLENYYPNIRKMLLSTDKEDYIAGIIILSVGLYDGGHTAIEGTVGNISSKKISEYIRLDENSQIVSQYSNSLISKMTCRTSLTTLKKKAFKGYESSKNPDVYIFDAETKTAYVCFDSFSVDYDGWDYYYNNGMNEKDIPTTGDSFSFIKSSFYRALEDGAENVIIDLTTNGGGDSTALCGIVGILNGGKCDFSINNVIDRSRTTDHCAVDFNLDGEFDEKDVEELEKFTFNVGVLTSSYSFSCANLLSSMLKELGYKIIGQKSGGGSCAVSYTTSADGVSFFHSNPYCLSNAGGDNIDTGVPLDFEIASPVNYYDFVTIADYFSSLKSAK